MTMQRHVWKYFNFLHMCSNGVSTLRLCRTLSTTTVKPTLYKKMGIRYYLSKSVTKYQHISVRMLYYLENLVPTPYNKFPSTLEMNEEVIANICFSKNPASIEEWDDCKIEILTSCMTLNDENFDSVLMQVLLTHEKIHLAMSFMQYLKERNFKPNFVTLCKFMVLCSKNRNVVGQEVILEAYDKVNLLLKDSILDAKMVQHLVGGLCATDKWRKSFTYTSQLRRHQMTNETVNSLVCASLRNNDYKLAWDILNNWYKIGAMPSCEVLEEYMRFLIKLHKKNDALTYSLFLQLSAYVQNRGIIFKKNTALVTEDYFKRSNKWTVAKSTINRDGVCSSCQKQLEPCSLTEEEFISLKDCFLKFSVKKSDIFINTTSHEFERFYKFVERFKPFDIVLDGLNVAHGDTNSKKTAKALSAQLLNVVSHLSQSMKNILVLGRHHMKDWPRSKMRALHEKSHVFYVSNISQDDPFLIHAALASGPNCILVSMDMMRDHIARLPDPKLIYLFKKWQQSHQVYLAGQDKDKIKLMGPLRHSIAIQGSMEAGWHIPFDNEVKREPYEELNNWLCVQKQCL